MKAPYSMIRVDFLKRIVGLFLALALIGCATDHNPKTVLSPELEKEFNREVKGKLPLQTVKSGDNFFKVQLNLAERPIVKYNFDIPLYSFEAAIGAEEKVHCIIYQGQRDIAALVESAFKAFITNNLSVRNWRIDRIASGVMEAYPYYRLNVFYRAKLKDDYIIGEMKFFVYARLDSTILIIHDEFGYNESFMKFAESFVGALVITPHDHEEDSPTKRFIFICRINNVPVGFIHERDYGNRYVTENSILLPAEYRQLIASDDIVTEFFDEKGDVIRLESITSGDGNEVINVKMEKIAENLYSVSGKTYDETIGGHFKTPVPIPGSREIQAQIKEKILTQNEPSFSVLQYLPKIDPTKAIQSLIINNGNQQIKVITGDVEVTTDFDDAGNVKQTEMMLESKRIICSLAWSSEEADHPSR